MNTRRRPVLAVRYFEKSFLGLALESQFKSEMTPPGPWCLLLFLLAFLDLAANLAAFSAETSLLSGGLRVQTSTCGGLWSCAQLFCRLGNDSNLTVVVPPRPRERSADCAVQGLSWLWR